MRAYSRDAAIWEELARTDPVWAVCSRRDFRGAGRPPDAFWRSGREEVEDILSALRRVGIEPGRDRALDFGCGLGRLTRPLADHFDEVVGVDVSAAMVASARRFHADCMRCAFTHSIGIDLAGHESGSFDFVISLITLQHVRSRAQICRFISEFVRLLKPGGIAVFQVPTHVPRRIRWHPLRLVASALGAGAVRRAPVLAGYSMALTAVPQDRVVAVVEADGGRMLHAVPDTRAGSPMIESVVFVAERG